jgi:ubiquinone/menaquinone biosynthesis C-methylase UbiE
VDYRVGTLSSLPYASASMDFILASHVLEYNSEDSLAASAAELDRVLKPGRPILIRVASTRHVFCGASPAEVYGFSHIGFCIKNGLPVHFFTDTELRLLFKRYRVERLEHVSHRLDHERITVPLSEWVMLAYKPAA